MQPIRIPNRKYLVIIPLILGAIVVAALYKKPGVSMDATTYLQMARSMQYGMGLGWIATWVPPLYSILIYLVDRIAGFNDLLFASGVVSVFMGILLPPAIFFLASAIFDIRTALAASVLAAVFPHFLILDFACDPEITYSLLLTVSLLLLYRTIECRSLPTAMATGIAFGLTWMTRSEGFLVMSFVLTSLTVIQGLRFYRTFVFKAVLTVTLFFILTSLPYLTFLRQHYGAWIVSPKSSYVMAWMKSRIYNDNDKGEIFNDEIWGLNSEGKMRFQEPTGVRDLAGYLMSHPSKSLSVYLHNLSLEIPGRIPNNSGSQHLPQVYPFYLVAFALFAAFRRWGEQSAEKKVVILSPFLILLVLPIFSEGWWKYLLPYAPLLFIAGAAGMVMIVDLAAKRLRLGQRLSEGLLAGAVVLLAVYFGSLNRQPPSAPISLHDAGRGAFTEEARKAGEWAAQKFGPGKNYMTVWDKSIFFMNGIWTPMPMGSNFQIIQFAIKHKVDFAVFELANIAVTDEELQAAPHGFTFVDRYRSPEFVYILAFYRLNNISKPENP